MFDLQQQGTNIIPPPTVVSRSIPRPEQSSMAALRPFRFYRCLTFDCFGTLVNWEKGIYDRLTPLMKRLPASHPLHNDRLGTLKAFTKHETRVQTERPSELYRAVLASAYGDLAAELGVEASAEDKASFGASVGDWPAFPDTVAALKRLHKHFKLVILSNVDKESFKRTLSGPLNGIEFDAIYTAQDIGTYKPDVNNFNYLIEHCEKDLGVRKEDIIHTAQSLFHDMVPATKVGLTSAWIERGQEIESVMGGDLRDFEGTVNLTWRFKTLEDMADAVDSAATPDHQI
jgi:2-haloalkanoic acid dehalogenase type II